MDYDISQHHSVICPNLSFKVREVAAIVYLLPSKVVAQLHILVKYKEMNVIHSQYIFGMIQNI